MANYYGYIVPQGLITVDTSTLQQDVTIEYTGVFGTGLNTSPNSPAGLLITTETIARADVLNNNAALANQLNPSIAGGVYLDAIMALTGTQRIGQTYTTVNVVITGIPGTFIAAGALASDSILNNVYALQQSVTVPAGGTVAGIFVSILPGAIPCTANTLTQILSNLIGWLTVNNPAQGTLGSATQSDQQALVLRNNALFAQGASMAGAIIANVSLLPGFNSMKFRENVAATTETIDGVTMVSHSMYACVSATDSNLAIATAIAEKKDGGCSYNNGASMSPISQPVIQPVSGQTIDVLFDRPDMISCIARVYASQGTAVTPNLTLSIQSAVYNWAQGVVAPVGIPPALTVGANLSAFEVAAAIVAAVPGIYIQNVQVSLATPVSYTNVINADVWQQLFFANFNAVFVLAPV